MRTNFSIMWYLTPLVILMISSFIGAVTVTRQELTPAGGCRVRSWTSWSPCPVSCGHGEQRRARFYQSEKKCMLERQTQLCFKARCLAPKDAPCPSPAGAWGDCSVTCGGGTRLRFRNEHGYPPGSCFIIPESASCRQQPCNMDPSVIQKCKELEDVTSASLSTKQLYLPGDIRLHRCARLVYTIIAPLSYGVNLTVSVNSDFTRDSKSKIEIIEQNRTALGTTHQVLYKGEVSAGGYRTESNTMVVQLEVKNAPLFSGITISFEAYKVDGHGRTVEGCPSQCHDHVHTLPTGTRGILSLPETSHLCVTTVWVIKPFLVLPSLVNKDSDILQSSIFSGSSLLFHFPQLTLPPTDYIEAKDGDSALSSVMYQGQILPLRLITSGLSVRLTVHICNISLYRNFRISYQRVPQQPPEVEISQTTPTMSSTDTVAATDMKTMKTPTSTPHVSSSDITAPTSTPHVSSSDITAPTSTPHVSSSDITDREVTHVVGNYITSSEAKATSNLPPTTTTPSMSPSRGSRLVRCSVAQTPKYLRLSPRTTLYAVGTNVTVTCTHIKKNIEGQNTFLCSQAGTWLPHKWPRCINKQQKKKCFDPPEVNNAYFRRKVYHVGHRVTYVCKTRYEITGDQTLTCVDNGGELGEWNKFPPKCEAVTVPCNVTQWSQWSPCSLVCGEGTQHRSRVQILDNNIANCRAEQDTRPCPVVEPCPTPQVFWPCGGNIQKSKGQLSSPGYPYGYLSNQECIWKITVARGQKIQLHFHEINTEKMFDIVEVRDGGYNHSRLLGEFSGEGNNSKVKTSGNTLYIRLLTDGTNEGKGFQAEFASAGKPQLAPCGDDLTASHELQTLSLQPGSLKSMDCFWTISTSGQGCCSESAALRLNITMIDTMPKEEVLEVRDGVTRFSPLVGIFSGQELHGHQKWLYDLHSCHAYINYWSVEGNALPTNSKKGFSLSYQIIEY